MSAAETPNPTEPRPLLGRLWPPLLAAVLMIAVWEFAVWWFKLPNYVLPTPQEILAAGWIDPRRLWEDTATTLLEALAGYAGGATLGLALAILFVIIPVTERLALPLYVTVNSVPMIAYGPLAIIWFGIGSASKIALIVVAVSYTVLINTLAGMRACDAGTIAMLRSFGATRRDILLKLRLPHALPMLFSGLRVAVVHAMILAVVLEMLGARAGLGWNVYQSTQMMSFVDAWVAVAASVIVSLMVYTVVNWAGRRIAWW